ncbi:hypothetical protein FKM82_008434 [Ascaphus truei]
MFITVYYSLSLGIIAFTSVPFCLCISGIVLCPYSIPFDFSPLLSVSICISLPFPLSHPSLFLLIPILSLYTPPHLFTLFPSTSV